jgi:hypothetical protein
VVVLQELIHESRIIPLDGRDGPPAHVQQWLGVSRGRWEATRSSWRRGTSIRVQLPRLVTAARADRTLHAVARRRHRLPFTMHDPATYVKDWTVGGRCGARPASSRSSNTPATRGTSRWTGILAGARREEKEAAKR